VISMKSEVMPSLKRRMTFFGYHPFFIRVNCARRDAPDLLVPNMAFHKCALSSQGTPCADCSGMKDISSRISAGPQFFEPLLFFVTFIPNNYANSDSLFVEQYNRPRICPRGSQSTSGMQRGSEHLLYHLTDFEVEKGFIRENRLLLTSQRVLVHPALQWTFNSTRPVLSFTDTPWKFAVVNLLHQKPSV
jgi:hypothetical protein